IPEWTVRGREADAVSTIRFSTCERPDGLRPGADDRYVEGNPFAAYRSARAAAFRTLILFVALGRVFESGHRSYSIKATSTVAVRKATSTVPRSAAVRP